jgi:hypothetical protein
MTIFTAFLMLGVHYGAGQHQVNIPVDDMALAMKVRRSLKSRYFWTIVTGGEGSCINPQVIVGAFYGYTAVACITDWTFAVLPAFLVKSLRMGSREKASVILILSMGVLTSIASIARIPYVGAMVNPLRHIRHSDLDRRRNRSRRFGSLLRDSAPSDPPSVAFAWMFIVERTFTQRYKSR